MHENRDIIENVPDFPIRGWPMIAPVRLGGSQVATGVIQPSAAPPGSRTTAIVGTNR